MKVQIKDVKMSGKYICIVNLNVSLIFDKFIYI